MPVRGIRGAIDILDDQPNEILSATRDLLQAILRENPSLKAGDVASILFTLTDDLNSAYPAQAAREMGWIEVPLMCGREVPVPGSLPRCIRVLFLWNTNVSQENVRHVYLRGTASLRPDMQVQKQPQEEEF